LIKETGFDRYVLKVKILLDNQICCYLLFFIIEIILDFLWLECILNLNPQ